MLGNLHGAIGELEQAGTMLPAAEVAESLAFLRWLADDHLTLLGYRRHDLVVENDEDALRTVPGSGLGVLRESAQEKNSASFAAVPASARAMAHAPTPVLVVTRANTRSTVHRPGYTDYVGIKRYDAQGKVIGEHRFVGLFTSTAYSAPATDIPLLRDKIKAVAARSALPKGGHLAKALGHILATYPRDDLFQIGEDDLYAITMRILSTSERQRLRLFTWRDPYERFVSCLIYVPREAYSTELRVKFQNILMEALGGVRADFDVQLGNTILARVHLTIRTGPGLIPDFEVEALEARLTDAARRWDDKLREALVEEVGEASGMALFKRWGAAFPQVYREIVSARAAVPDVIKIAGMSKEKPLALSLYRPLGASARTLGFKVYRLGAKVVLSDSLPMLEHMGARVLGEDNFAIGGGADGGEPVSMHDFKIEAQAADEIEPEALARLFEGAFARVFNGEIESDEINRLVLRAGLTADEVSVLRAYVKYLRQIGFAPSQSMIRNTLVVHPRISRMLVGLFKLRFDPVKHDDEAAAAQVKAIEQALEKVSNLAEDRVLRQILALIGATLRTNYWRTGEGHSGAPGPRRSFISFKFDSSKVPGLPAPKPLVEIFVYSPRFEGIHLRGGKVARGGLRWSDRAEDFRTEVLGLVKAQMVKNTVIVPVGSKGGFVLKKAPPASDREAYLAEGVACYKDYLRALLDVTDNRVAGAVVPPPLVRRIDGDDPYLVVAADKGTATFSDHANAVSLEYGHWLGDAFASGGSVGYDHKAMGITARGAWESVKRHFRELGVDTQSTDFTVVGVGDMSGDVFGNGMLLSRHIRLLAAFDHRHVFIDPEPDAAKSFVERERLFKLPRSSWADYDTQLISAGGGVWSRAEKSIPLSPQARAALGIEAERLTPGRAAQCDPEGAGRPALQRRHRHLRQVQRREPRRCRRPRQRRHPRRRQPVALQGGGRRRQPGLHAARPHRGGAQRCAHLHRCHRQLGRRRHLGPRGQHQDPARPGQQRRRDDRTPAQQPAAADDRRGGAAGAGRQLPADAGHLGGAATGGAAARPPGALHAPPRAFGAARPRHRVPAHRRRDRAAQGARRGPDRPRVRGAAGLQQDVAVRRADRIRPGRRPLDRRRTAGLLPDAAAREVRRLDPAPPAQARDHRHACAQRHDQPRRRELRAPADRDHRRAAGADRARLPGDARSLRPAIAVVADRGAGQQGRRRTAVGHAHRTEEPEPARHHLVPASQAPVRADADPDRAAATRGAGAAHAARTGAGRQCQGASLDGRESAC